MSMWTDVRAFHDRFKIRPRMRIPTPLHQLADGTGLERLRHLQEELNELRAAAEALDVAAEADALVDLVYVALGTALMMGLPWEGIWAAVQAANMSKVPGDGPKQVAKPAGWRDPIEKIRTVISEARLLGGYEWES